MKQKLMFSLIIMVCLFYFGCSDKGNPVSRGEQRDKTETSRLIARVHMLSYDHSTYVYEPDFAEDNFKLYSSRNCEAVSGGARQCAPVEVRYGYCYIYKGSFYDKDQRRIGRRNDFIDVTYTHIAKRIFALTSENNVFEYDVENKKMKTFYNFPVLMGSPKILKIDATHDGKGQPVVWALGYNASVFPAVYVVYRIYNNSANVVYTTPDNIIISDIAAKNIEEAYTVYAAKESGNDYHYLGIIKKNEFIKTRVYCDEVDVDYTDELYVVVRKDPFNGNKPTLYMLKGAGSSPQKLPIPCPSILGCAN